MQSGSRVLHLDLKSHRIKIGVLKKATPYYTVLRRATPCYTVSRSGFDYSSAPDASPANGAAALVTKPRLDALIVEDVLLRASYLASFFRTLHLTQTNGAIIVDPEVGVERGRALALATTPPSPRTPLPAARTRTRTRPRPRARRRTISIVCGKIAMVGGQRFSHGCGNRERYSFVVPFALDVLEHPRLFHDVTGGKHVES